MCQQCQFNVQVFNDNIAALSKDTSTKVAATLVDNKGNVVSYGYNGLLRGMADDDVRYANKNPKPEPTNDEFELADYLYKYDWFEHAERNCLYNFIRLRSVIKLSECLAIISKVDSLEDVRALLSVGIKKLVIGNINSDWKKSDVAVFEHMIDVNHAKVYLVEDNTKYHTILNALLQGSNGQNVCAIFHNDLSMVSVGIEGSMISEYFAQSAVKNSIANLIKQYINEDFKIYVSLAPCTHCSKFLLNCGFKIENIIVNNSSKSQSTSNQWQQQFDEIKQKLAQM